MARYIDADAMMEKIRKCKFEITGCGIVYDAGEVQSVIRHMPTADVVPKSESLPLDVHEALMQRAVETAKAEVAREIFEEIWATIATHAFTAKSEDYEDGAYDTIEWVDSKIAEVEKKYAEEKV